MNTPPAHLPTAKSLPISAWLDVLAATMPPTGIVLVGAGNGTSALAQWLLNAQAPCTMVEGDATQQPHLHHLAQTRANLHVLREVVAPSTAPIQFHHYSNPVENGLLTLAPLQKLWPQLSQTHSTWVEDPITINQLVADHIPQTNWLILDCNASAELLYGATEALPHLDVLVCRQSEADASPTVGPELRRVTHLTGRHPGIGHSIWVRDVAVETQARQQEAAAKADALKQRDELAQAQAELTQTLKQAQLTQAELQQKVDELHQKLEDEAQALQQEAVTKAQAQKQLEEVTAKQRQATTEAEQNKRRADELQKQVDSALGRMVKAQVKLLASQAAEADAALLEQQKNQPAQPKFQPQCVAEFNLGQAWAGNTVNTAIFRHHGIFTHQGHQFASFYVDEHTLRFVCRRLSDDSITQYDLAIDCNLKDAHNSISMGVDRQGYLHVCYDHHASQLRYRRSLQPMRIDGWTDDRPMTGQHEDKVTYPTFILPRANYPLTMLYRDGTHNKGSARLKYYDEKTQNWRDKPTPILSGAEQKPWSSNAYWNHPAIGTDGSLHLSFVWRTGVLGEEQLVNNINIGYAWSPDNGHHWYTLQGQPYQVPITPTTAETIWPVPPGSNLINQCSMALDKFNRPHIVFYANDAEGIPQYQHLRYDGKAWHHQILSQRTQPFNLAGGGTLQIPISRPCVLVDAQDNALEVFRGDLTNDRISMMKLCPPSYSATHVQPQILDEQPVGFAEPVLDREGYKLNNKLGLLLQHNAQPHHDTNPTLHTSGVRICEFEL